MGVIKRSEKGRNALKKESQKKVSPRKRLRHKKVPKPKPQKRVKPAPRFHEKKEVNEKTGIILDVSNLPKEELKKLVRAKDKDLSQPYLDSLKKSDLQGLYRHLYGGVKNEPVPLPTIEKFYFTSRSFADPKVLEDYLKNKFNTSRVPPAVIVGGKKGKKRFSALEVLNDILVLKHPIASIGDAVYLKAAVNKKLTEGTEKPYITIRTKAADSNSGISGKIVPYEPEHFVKQSHLIQGLVANQHKVGPAQPFTNKFGASGY